MNNERNQLKDELKDRLKRSISAESLANYIAQKTGEPINRTHDGFRVGKNNGISISQKDDCALVNAFNGHIKNGDVFSVVADFHGLDKDKDFPQVLELTCNEFDMPYSPIIHEVQPESKPEPLNQDQKDVYNQFMKSHWECLKAGLECESCQRLFKERGLDPFKITNFDNVGYAEKPIDCVRYGTDKNHDTPTRLNYQIPANSLVFRDNKQIKVITFDKTGHRSKDKQIQQLISGAGSCHWIAAKIEQTDVYLCEGETSAIALLFQGLNAIPLKCEGDGVSIATQIARDGHRLILAYDNDKTGRGLTEKAFRCLSAPAPIDISGLWSGDGFQDGADPNDYTTKHKLDNIQELITAEINRQSPKDTTPIDRNDKDAIRKIEQYFLAKSENNQTECQKRAMNDSVVGGFIKLVDPYAMRSYAPVACIVSYAMAMLAKYRIEYAGASYPRIINLVAKSCTGKDWILGTDYHSNGLCEQLNKNAWIDAGMSANASITGNGMSLDAFLWAANDANKNKVRVRFWPEMGNAQTRGYGQSERSGSIGNFDMQLCYGKIHKPQTKAEQRDLKEYANEYPYNAFEVRAFQDINGAKVVAPRMQGAGEARREFWFYMSNPKDEPIFTDKNASLLDNAIQQCAFTPDNNNKAYAILNENVLGHAGFNDQQSGVIKVDSNNDSYWAVYDTLLETITNEYFRADKFELTRNKFGYCVGLSAGLHGRTTPIDDDYWIGGYFVECLANSLDAILECAPGVDDPESIKTKIVERVKSAGLRGVRADKLSFDQKALDELCDKITTKDGVCFGNNSIIQYRLNAKRQRIYFHVDFVKDAEQKNPDLKFPTQ